MTKIVILNYFFYRFCKKIMFVEQNSREKYKENVGLDCLVW